MQRLGFAMIRVLACQTVMRMVVRELRAIDSAYRKPAVLLEKAQFCAVQRDYPSY
jgi:hypothetical protein